VSSPIIQRSKTKRVKNTFGTLDGCTRFPRTKTGTAFQSYTSRWIKYSREKGLFKYSIGGDGIGQDLGDSVADAVLPFQCGRTTSRPSHFGFCPTVQPGVQADYNWPPTRDILTHQPLRRCSPSPWWDTGGGFGADLGAGAWISNVGYQDSMLSLPAFIFSHSSRVKYIVIPRSARRRSSLYSKAARMTHDFASP